MSAASELCMAGVVPKPGAASTVLAASEMLVAGKLRTHMHGLRGKFV
jgi:hypothetical protein